MGRETCGGVHDLLRRDCGMSGCEMMRSRRHSLFVILDAAQPNVLAGHGVGLDNGRHSSNTG